MRVMPDAERRSAIAEMLLRTARCCPPSLLSLNRRRKVPPKTHQIVRSKEPLPAKNRERFRYRGTRESHIAVAKGPHIAFGLLCASLAI